MKTIDDAWVWYKKTRKLIGLTRRIAAKYWVDLPWDKIGSDDHFRDLGAEDVTADVEAILDVYDDVAVLLLFSVFERAVRDRVIQEVEVEATSLKHPALRGAAHVFLKGLEEKGFYENVLEPYKDLDADLVEQVNQVRRYRNWVAHGRRLDRRPSSVTPLAAFERLSAFLKRIGDDPP